MGNGHQKKTLPWRVRHSELVLNNQFAKVRRDVCELPDGSIIPDYYYWEGGDFAQVFALTAADEILLARQYKHGVKEIVVELPAGLAEPDDEKAVATAQRELKEETGYTGGDWIELGRLNVSSAKATTRASAFLAKGVERTCEPHPDVSEAIEVLLLTLEEVLAFILRGEIRDANSVATTFLALQSLGQGFSGGLSK